MIVHMIGNAHIDPVWLWRWQCGVDEALATFRSAVDRCHEYPDFIFTRGEAWLYQQVENLDPGLFAEVQALVASGQWFITGGQYLQPDTNMPTLAGWQRQIEHGQRYFQQRFGIQPLIGYNVDAFGHAAFLPDLYASYGYQAYVFGRPDEKQVPSIPQLFRWQGIHGGELLVFRLPHATYNTRVDDLYGAIMRSVDQADPHIGHTMCFYGVGNHGGGPTKANIEYILSHISAFPDVELRFSTPQNYFDAISEYRTSLPVVTAELQHTFPGCYSVMHPVKQGQQHGEARLVQAERMVEAFVAEPVQKENLATRIDRAWDDLLLTQFHDILSGTSIPSAWPDVYAIQGRAMLTADEVIVTATRRWSRKHLQSAPLQRIVALNANADEWSGWVEAEPSLDFDVWGQRWLSDTDHRPIPYQIIQAESPQMIQRIVFPLRIPAQGYSVVLLQQDASTQVEEIQTDLSVSPHHLANSRLQLDLTSTGIEQLRLDGQIFLSSPGIGLHLRDDHTDTWTFTTDQFTESVRSRFVGEGWVVEENGPLRARVRQEGWLDHSRVRWTLTLYQGETHVDMQLEILFAEHYKLLQLTVPLMTKTEQWLSGLAMGNIERQPGPVEWPFQGWSHVRFANQQLAIVTPDIYSISLQDQLWQWTLLRSPKMAWMGDEWGGGKTSLATGRGWFTDQGAHTFRLTLYADQQPETLPQLAQLQLQSPVVFDYYDGMNRPAWGNEPPFHLR